MDGNLSQETPSPRVCRRCLLEDLEDERAALMTVREWVAALPEDKRAPERVYRARLTVCAACDQLNRGTCALCGCYVEFRAALAALPCPHVPTKWASAENSAIP